jgi:hypothetical protein
MQAVSESPFQLFRNLVGVCIFVTLLCVVEIAAQPTRTYPAFTMTIQTTAYDASGQSISSFLATRYDSTSGDWRYVRTVGGYEIATLYRRGRGVYFADSRTQLILKTSDHAAGCPLRSAEQLRDDPKFVRTEMILGFEAYFLSRRFPGGDFVEETSFVPELGGGIPFKRVYAYDDGRRIVEEPIAVTLGEPEALALNGPDYPVIEQLPVFSKDMEANLTSKPAPAFPPDSDTGGFGNTVFVSVIIDETGRVVTANANTSVTFLDEPAIVAAYQATFEPVICNGKPAMARRLLRYKFVSPQLAKTPPQNATASVVPQ